MLSWDKISQLLWRQLGEQGFRVRLWMWLVSLYNIGGDGDKARGAVGFLYLQSDLLWDLLNEFYF